MIDLLKKILILLISSPSKVFFFIGLIFSIPYFLIQWRNHNPLKEHLIVNITPNFVSAPSNIYKANFTDHYLLNNVCNFIYLPIQIEYYNNSLDPIILKNCSITLKQMCIMNSSTFNNLQIYSYGHNYEGEMIKFPLIKSFNSIILFYLIPITIDDISFLKLTTRISNFYDCDLNKGYPIFNCQNNDPLHFTKILELLCNSNSSCLKVELNINVNSKLEKHEECIEIFPIN